MTAPLDLDALVKTLTSMTPGPWRIGYDGDAEDGVVDVHRNKVVATISRHPIDGNVGGIVAIVNAAPALIAEIRSLRLALGEAFCAGHDAGWNDRAAAEMVRLRAEWSALSHGPPVLPEVDRDGDKERALAEWRRLASGQGKVEP